MLSSLPLMKEEVEDCLEHGNHVGALEILADYQTFIDKRSHREPEFEDYRKTVLKRCYSAVTKACNSGKKPVADAIVMSLERVVLYRGVPERKDSEAV